MRKVREIHSFLVRFDKTELGDDLGPCGDLAPKFEICDAVDDAGKEREIDVLKMEIRRLQQESEILLENERERFRVSLNAERERWVAEQSELLSAGLTVTLSRLAQDIALRLERVLVPFVAKNVIQKLIEEFVDTVRMAAIESNIFQIVIEAPEDFSAILTERLTAAGLSVETKHADTVEVTARINGTLIETRIDHWLDLLKHGGYE